MLLWYRDSTYSNHHTDGEMTANPVSQKISPSQLGKNSNLLVLGSQNEILLKKKYFHNYYMANNLCTSECTSSCLLAVFFYK